MPIGLRLLRRPPTLDPAVVRQLAAFRTTDLADAMYGAQTMKGIHGLHPAATRVAGPAVTVNAPQGGFDIVKLGMEQTSPGDVLVIAGGGSRLALWGGNLSRGLKARGVIAAVVDGYARDAGEIAAEEFPTYAKGTSTAADPVHLPYGEVNVPIACGGVVVRPGDIIVADNDGVVAVPFEAVDSVARRAAEVVEKLASLQPQLVRGEVTSLAAIEDRFAQAGIEVEPL